MGSACADAVEVCCYTLAGLQMSHFRKKKDCPDSYELADSIIGQMSGEQGLRIAKHIGWCDFCAAELELYQHFPPYDLDVPAPPIPIALRELAESLLTGETIHISKLEGLFRDAA